MVARDNCVIYLGKKLQIPPDPTRLQYVKARVRIHHYLNDELAIFHGPRLLARYRPNGELIQKTRKPENQKSGCVTRYVVAPPAGELT